MHTLAFMVRLGRGECLSSLGVDKKDKRRELTDGEGWTDGRAILRDDPEGRVVSLEGRQWRKRRSGSWMQLSATGNTKLERERETVARSGGQSSLDVF